MILTEADIEEIQVRGYHTETECTCGSDVPMLLESHEELRRNVIIAVAVLERLERWEDRGSNVLLINDALKAIRGES